MIERYRDIKRQKAAGEREEGFTLIELLIVIVVLGILAAVVIFALGGVTGSSSVAACNSDAKTVETALAAYQAQEGSYPATGSTTTGVGAAATVSDTALTTAAADGNGPWLHTFPNNASAGYLITVAATTGVVSVTTNLTGTPVTTAYDSETSAAGCAKA